MIDILITGLNSYVGNSFYDYIKNNYNSDYNVYRISLKNTDIAQLDLKAYDVVLHVSGIAHSDYGRITEKRSNLYYEINTDLTCKLAKKAKEDGVTQFIYMSSIIVYGKSAPIGVKKNITKETIPYPSNAYGDSKLKAEEKLKLLHDESFIISIIRSPMVYGNNSKGNYKTLEKIALNMPFFPYVENEKSAIRIDNLCIFIKSIIDNKKSGIFFPQDEKYMNTSEMVKRIANNNNNNILLLNGFVPILKFMSKFIPMINKAFGNMVYDRELYYKEF